MAKWIKYSAEDTSSVVGFVNLDSADAVVPSAADGTWVLRVNVDGHNYTIATGTGDVDAAVAAFESFLAGDNLPNGA